MDAVVGRLRESGFLDRSHLPTPVEPALWTDLMGRLPLVTLWTDAKDDGVEALVRTPLCGP